MIALALAFVSLNIFLIWLGIDLIDAIDRHAGAQRDQTSRLIGAINDVRRAIKPDPVPRKKRKPSP